MDEVSDSEQLWRLTVENSPVGMALVATDGRLMAVNRALSEMLGYDATTLREKSFQEVTHPEDLDEDLELLRQTLAGHRSSYRLRKRYLHADGRIVWGDLSVALLRRSDGRPLHFISQILDVTAQHQYEERLAAAHDLIDRQRRMAEAVYDSVDVGLVLIDAEGNYETMNRRQHDFMSLAYPDGHRGRAGQLGAVYGADGSTLMTREQMPTYRAQQAEEFDAVRIWVGADPAERRALSVSARTVHDPQGGFAGAALAYTDITDLMRALAVKDEFVASVSHELRTPLTAVLGHLELLNEESLPETIADRIQVVERNAVRLRHLVSDLLQVRDGDVRLDRRPTDVGALLRDAIEGARPGAEVAGLRVSLDPGGIGHADGVVAVLDEDRIRQVVDNLVSNALKYTDTGGSVRVAARLDRDSIVIEVTDTGIGIEPDELERVFTRFFRGQLALDRQIPGTGLGLSIVHAIVAAHGGTIDCTSRPGGGTTFCVRIPFVDGTDAWGSVQGN